MPEQRFRIRPGGHGDVSFLVDANHAMASETEDKALDRDTLRAGVEAALKDPSRGTYSIVEDASGPVGCLLITREWSDWRNAWIWWIQSVYVRPEKRGQGAYGALHRNVIDRARDAGNVRAVRLYVDKTNARAQGVYRSLGMTVSRYDLMETET